MNQYVVHFKNKKSATIQAYGYTQKEDRYLFHKKEDKSDSDTFVFANDLIGIDNQGEIEPPIGIHLG